VEGKPAIRARASGQAARLAVGAGRPSARCAAFATSQKLLKRHRFKALKIVAQVLRALGLSLPKPEFDLRDIARRPVVAIDLEGGVL
jgi:hypothetical protein